MWIIELKLFNLSEFRCFQGKYYVYQCRWLIRLTQMSVECCMQTSEYCLVMAHNVDIFSQSNDDDVWTQFYVVGLSQFLRYFSNSHIQRLQKRRTCICFGFCLITCWLECVGNFSVNIKTDFEYPELFVCENEWEVNDEAMCGMRECLADSVLDMIWEQTLGFRNQMIQSNLTSPLHSTA